MQLRTQDAARTDQQNEWERQREDRQRQFEHEALVAVQDAITRFSDASRWLHLDRVSRYHFERRSEKKEGAQYVSSPSVAAYGVTFNDLRFNILPIISRVRNERVRSAAMDLYVMGMDMVLLEPRTWEGEIYGGDDPVQIQERRLPQFIRMTGKLLRDEPIDDEQFPAITRTQGDGYLVHNDWVVEDN